MIDLQKLKIRHDELSAKGIANLTETERYEIEEIAIALKRADKDGQTRDNR